MVPTMETDDKTTTTKSEITAVVETTSHKTVARSHTVEIEIVRTEAINVAGIQVLTRRVKGIAHRQAPGEATHRRGIQGMMQDHAPIANPLEATHRNDQDPTDQMVHHAKSVQTIYEENAQDETVEKEHPQNLVCIGKQEIAAMVANVLGYIQT